jgi:hypothetical protein
MSGAVLLSEIVRRLRSVCWSLAAEEGADWLRIEPEKRAKSM